MNIADPRPDPAFDPERFMTYARRIGHGGALGIAYHAHGDDWAELSLPYDPRLVGMPDSGIIASGPIISLMDMATSIAIWVCWAASAPRRRWTCASIICAPPFRAARSSDAANAME